MSYNLTAIANNSGNYLGFIQGINDELMFGWFGILLLISLIIVFFSSFYFSTGEFKKSLAGTAFIAFGLSIFLRALDLIPNLALYIVLIGAGLALAFSFSEY